MAAPRCPFHTRPRKQPQRPPGSGGLPWLGQFYAFVRDIRGFVTQRHKRHGDVFWARVYSHKTVFVATAEANNWLFAGEHDYLRKDWPGGWRKLAGRKAQTVVTDPKTHERQMKIMRRVLAPTPEMLRVYVSTIDAHLERWERSPGVDPYVDLKLLTLHTDAEALLGLRLSDAQCRWLLGEFGKLVKGFSCLLPFDFPFFPFSRAMASRRRLQEFFGEVIEEQLVELDASSIRTPPKWRRASPRHEHPLRLLLRDAISNPQIAMDELRDQLQILIFAGHEFPGAAITGACLELLRRPEAVTELRWECDALDTQHATLDSLGSLPLLDAFVREVLRVYPPVPGGYRVLTRDVELEGHSLPRGWRVKFEPFLTHFDPRYWREPQRFDPSRFLSPRSEHQANRGAYVPFGGGARMCPGARYGSLFVKTFLLCLIKRYDLSFVGTPGLESKFGHVFQPHYEFRLQQREQPAISQQCA